jgi:hypothetical protein
MGIHLNPDAKMRDAKMDTHVESMQRPHLNSWKEFGGSEAFHPLAPASWE